MFAHQVRTILIVGVLVVAFLLARQADVLPSPPHPGMLLAA